jgi:hypothetical protein
MPPNVQLPFVFVEQACDRVRSMKLACRNRANHAAGKPVILKSGFEGYAAEEVIIAVRGLMREIAEGLRNASVG